MSLPELTSLALKLSNQKLLILDQTKLPHTEGWIEVKSTSQMVEIIKKLQVRGAPLIGVSAALQLAVSASQGASKELLLQEAELLRESRPTAVNLMIAIDRLKKKLQASNDDQNAFIEDAISIFHEDVDLCKKMALAGASLFQDGDQILTHCNTGGLATAGVGTALGVIRQAFEEGKKIHVYVDETRPLLQGGRLTTYELSKLGIPYTLITDSMAAFLMKQKKITKAIVGADRICENGDFANKIGTYSVALSCKHHGIPFYVAAPSTTLDLACKTGDQIPIEERSEKEVLGLSNVGFEVAWAKKGSTVYNPAFDVTPGELVTKFILDDQVLSPEKIATTYSRF